MTARFPALSVAELLALAVDASRRGDAGRAIEYLKDATQRPDTSAPACFLLGSEYAQIGLMQAAADLFQQALAIDPAYAIARFQLGLLRFTQQDVEAARHVWADLSMLGEADALVHFRESLLSLAAGRIRESRERLASGVEANRLYPPLSGELTQLVERMCAAMEPEGSPAVVETEEAGGHLLLNAYMRGQVH